MRNATVKIADRRCRNVIFSMPLYQWRINGVIAGRVRRADQAKP
jgi:hypothetical protein